MKEFPVLYFLSIIFWLFNFSTNISAGPHLEISKNHLQPLKEYVPSDLNGVAKNYAKIWETSVKSSFRADPRCKEVIPLLDNFSWKFRGPHLSM